MDLSQKEIKETAQCIKRYLKKYPRSADTAEGVMQWLAKQKYDDTLELVQMALRVLEDEGFVGKTTQIDGRTIFRCLEVP